MSAPRIAIVFRGIGGIGGTNNTIADHAREFTARGYAVDLIGEKIGRGGVTPDMGHGVAIRRLPLFKSRRWQSFADRADHHIQRGRYDFVAGHGHHRTQDVVSMHNCLHLAHEMIAGTALDPRGTLAAIHDALFAADRFSACICNSYLMQAELAQRYGIDRARLPVVYPGYRASQFRRADRPRFRDPIRAELGVRDELLLGLITSGDFKKRGLDILIQALARLEPGLRSGLRVLVLGKQGGNRQFIEQARVAGVADRLLFVGPTRSPERYFHALDICIHPARIEEFGQVVQEAMACAVPVIATRRVGAMECLPARHQAELASEPDAAGLAQAITDFAGSAELRDAWASVGHDSVVANTHVANLRATLAIYRAAGLPVTHD